MNQRKRERRTKRRNAKARPRFVFASIIDCLSLAASLDFTTRAIRSIISNLSLCPSLISFSLITTPPPVHATNATSSMTQCVPQFAVSIAVVISAILLGMYFSYKFEQAIVEEEKKEEENAALEENEVIQVQIITPQTTPSNSPVTTTGEESDDEIAYVGAKITPTNKRLSEDRDWKEVGRKRVDSGEKVNLSMEELASRFRSMAMGFGNGCGIALILFSGFVSNEKTPIWNREAKVRACDGLRRRAHRVA